jgi:hypothetical protein
VDRSIITSTVIREGIQRLPHAIDHSTQQLFAHSYGGLRAPSHDPVTISNSAQSLQRHGKHIGSTESNNLTGKGVPLGIYDLATLTHTAERAFRLHKVAGSLGNAAIPARRGTRLEILKIRS